MLTDIPRDRYGAWVPSLLHAVLAVLQQPSAPAAVGVASAALGGACELPGACTDWHMTLYSVHFQCADVDVDVFLTSDWSTTDADSAYPRYDALYDVTCQQTTHADRYWYILFYWNLLFYFVNRCHDPVPVRFVPKVKEPAFACSFRTEVSR